MAAGIAIVLLLAEFFVAVELDPDPEAALALALAVEDGDVLAAETVLVKVAKPPAG